MPVTVAWDENHPGIQHWKFTPPWNWDDFHAAFQQEVLMEKEFAGERYDIIADFLDSKGLPGGSGIANVAATFRNMPAKRRYTIAVSEERFISTLVSVYHRIYPSAKAHSMAATSIEEAIAICEGRGGGT
jgi:hypothetical protein